MEHLQKAIPVIAALDIANIRNFYQKGLGFKLGWNAPGRAIGDCDKIKINLWKCLDKFHPENTIGNVKFQGNAPLSQAIPANKRVHPDVPYRSTSSRYVRFHHFWTGMQIALNSGR